MCRIKLLLLPSTSQAEMGRTSKAVAAGEEIVGGGGALTANLKGGGGERVPTEAAAAAGGVQAAARKDRKGAGRLGADPGWDLAGLAGDERRGGWSV